MKPRFPQILLTPGAEALARTLDISRLPIMIREFGSIIVILLFFGPRQSVLQMKMHAHKKM